MEIHIRKLPGSDIEQEFYLVSEVDAEMEEMDRIRNQFDKSSQEEFESLLGQISALKKQMLKKLNGSEGSLIQRENPQYHEGPRSNQDGGEGMLIEQLGLPINISNLVTAAVNYGYNSNDARTRQALVDLIEMVKDDFVEDQTEKSHYSYPNCQCWRCQGLKSNPCIEKEEVK